ncbi:MAG TPA: adenylate kinase family protein [Candidatus Thermoplasmatota archaeon]|nr:adenylate kinase family protein [Candidatus Thermoplasmatota archaeon]
MAAKGPGRSRVALTGTPGVGKTTLAAIAAEDGWTVVDVKAWAKAEGCVVGYDEDDQAAVIDVKKLARRMPDGERLLFEGHLGHLLPVDVCWVVRCDPRTLRRRLEARGYKPAKVRENLEAEALDLILQEALDAVPRVVQRDGTRRSPQALYKAFADAGLGAAKADDLEPVDWSDELPIA